LKRNYLKLKRKIQGQAIRIRNKIAEIIENPLTMR